MTSVVMESRETTALVEMTNALATTPIFDLQDFDAGCLYSGQSGLGNTTTLTPYGYHSATGTFKIMYDTVTPTALLFTLQANAAQTLPAALFGVRFVKFVADHSDGYDAYFTFQIKGGA